VPDPHTSCGPYRLMDRNHLRMPTAADDEEMRIKHHPASATDIHHDTIGIVALDASGNIASGTTTNGATFKIPGYVSRSIDQSEDVSVS